MTWGTCFFEEWGPVVSDHSLRGDFSLKAPETRTAVSYLAAPHPMVLRNVPSPCYRQGSAFLWNISQYLEEKQTSSRNVAAFLL